MNLRNMPSIRYKSVGERRWLITILLALGTTSTGSDAANKYGGAAFIDGDVLLTGFFPVHNVASNGECDMKSFRIRNGFQLYDSFLYAINQVNSHQGRFKDFKFKLGGLALDDCNSPKHVYSTLHNVITGSGDFQDLTLKKIFGVVASLESPVTDKVADVLFDHKVSQISYGVLADKYDDTVSYPFLYLTVPTDSNVVQAKAHLLKRYGWPSVIVITDSSSYTQEGIEASVKSNGGCVIHTLRLNRTTTTVEEILREAVSYDNITQVVLLATNNTNTRAIVKAKASVKESDKIVFVGGRTLLDIFHDTPGSQTGLSRSIAVTPFSTKIPGYIDHLKSKSWSKTYPENPYFKTFFKKMHDCEHRDCPSSPVTSLKGFTMDVHVPYVIDAVYAMAYGIHGTLRELCGFDYENICEDFFLYQYWRDTLYYQIGGARFESVTSRPFRFYGVHGNLGFTVTRISKTGYEEVGTIQASNIVIAETSKQILTPPPRSRECRSGAANEKYFLNSKLVIIFVLLYTHVLCKI